VCSFLRLFTRNNLNRLRTSELLFTKLLSVLYEFHCSHFLEKPDVYFLSSCISLHGTTTEVEWNSTDSSVAVLICVAVHILTRYYFKMSIFSQYYPCIYLRERGKL
jgi:hypothetical protein